MEQLREEPPTAGELRTAVDRVVNGFVFNFETASQIVSRMMFYLADDLSKHYGDPTLPDGPERIKDMYTHVIDLFEEEDGVEE